MTLDVLYCKDLMVNVENSPVRTSTLFPKHVTFMLHVTCTGKYLKTFIYNVRIRKSCIDCTGR